MTNDGKPQPSVHEWHANSPQYSAAAWIAAALVLLTVLIVRWPEAVLGEDQQAQEHLPARRAAVELAGGEFRQAEDVYEAFIRQNDMGALREKLKGSLALARSQAESNSAALQEVLELIPMVSDYVTTLSRYAETGERYFDALRQYDDDLMAWTRSLGAESEQLRDDTFPIVEHLKEYPSPHGLRADPPLVMAAQVLTQAAALRESREALPDPGLSADVRRAQLDALDKLIDDIWASGRSIERLESLHADYRKYLEGYDAAVGRVVAAEGGAQSVSFPALAANVVVGLIVLAGFGLLFGARKGLPEA